MCRWYLKMLVRRSCYRPQEVAPTVYDLRAEGLLCKQHVMHRGVQKSVSERLHSLLPIQLGHLGNGVVVHRV